MSATNRSAAREAHPNDFFETPAWCTKAILPLLPSANVLDPCAGSGAILRAVRDEYPDALVSGYEINDALTALSHEHGLSVETRDALGLDPWRAADVILMNPPFALAEEFVRRALAEAQPTAWVVALLRVNWIASIKRMAFHRAHPADLYILPRRPSFTGKGTDACEYAWFVWRRFAGGRWQILEIPIEAAPRALRAVKAQVTR